MLLVFAFDWIYLNPLLREKVGCDDVVNELSAPPGHIVKKGFSGQKHCSHIEMNCNLRAAENDELIDKIGQQSTMI
jgi:hypothetical protein